MFDICKRQLWSPPPAACDAALRCLVGQDPDFSADRLRFRVRGYSRLNFEYSPPFLDLVIVRNVTHVTHRSKLRQWGKAPHRLKFLADCGHSSAEVRFDLIGLVDIEERPFFDVDFNLDIWDISFLVALEPVAHVDDGHHGLSDSIYFANKFIFLQL